MPIEAVLREIAEYTALGTEAIAVVVIAGGAIETLVSVAKELVSFASRTQSWRKDTFVRFGRWLLLGLQFALAADIVRSVIAPSWNDIGQLAAIAVIRTFLNYFLEKDIEEAALLTGDMARPDRAASESALSR